MHNIKNINYQSLCVLKNYLNFQKCTTTKLQDFHEKLQIDHHWIQLFQLKQEDNCTPGNSTINS